MSPTALTVITGAAGRLGRRTADLFHREGLPMVATDVTPRDDAPYPVRVVDLQDEQATADLLQGADTIIHLGNIPGLRHPQTTFNQNVTVNMNVFQGAAEQGVRKIIFASTLQLIGSHADRRTVVNPPGMPDYPMSGATPARPANTYALSKTVSETMLRYYAERCGLDCIAIRFPIILGPEYARWSRRNTVDETVVFEGFSCISFEDAVALILAVTKSDLPGFRVYMPGTSARVTDTPLSELIRTHLPGVPDTLNNLIDNSTITRETGWTPTHTTPD